jgi:hypothetical protein
MLSLSPFFSGAFNKLLGRPSFSPLRFLLVSLVGVYSLLSVGLNFAAQREANSKEAVNQEDNVKANDAKLGDTSSKAIIIPDVRGVNIDENIRLRRDLDEYTRTVDPAHVQIEERRRLMHKRLQERFAQIDRDGDGFISRDEALDGIPQLLRHFTSVDLNGDNFLSLDELEALQARILERQRTMTVRADASQESDNNGKKKSAKDNALNKKPAL